MGSGNFKFILEFILLFRDKAIVLWPSWEIALCNGVDKSSAENNESYVYKCILTYNLIVYNKIIMYVKCVIICVFT